MEEHQQSSELRALADFAAQRVDELIVARMSLEQRDLHLQILTQAVADNFDEVDPRVAAQRILQRVTASLEMDAGELWVVDWPTRRVLLVACEGIFPQLFQLGSALQVGEDLPGRAVATGEAMVSQDLQHEPRFMRQSIKDGGFHFYTAVPVRGADHVIGVLSLASLQPHPWSEEDSQILETVAKVLGRVCMDLLRHESDS